MKYSLIAVAAAAALATGTTQASTMNFNNGSGTYSADGVTANVSVTAAVSGHGLHYNGVENAIGVGSNNINGAMGHKQQNFIFFPEFTELETMTVSFDQEITVDTLFFRQWENNVLGFGDEVIFSYSGGTSGSGNLIFDDSGLIDGTLLDPFAAGVSLTSFTISPEQDGYNGAGAQNETAVYLHSLDFTVAEVPLPAAAWLFGTAMLGLVGVGRRRQSK